MSKEDSKLLERYFFKSTDSDPQLKEVLAIDASEGRVKTFPSDYILLLNSFKESVKNDPDPFRGRDLLLLVDESLGNIKIPLDEGKKFAAMLYTLCDTLEQKKRHRSGATEKLTREGPPNKGKSNGH